MITTASMRQLIAAVPEQDVDDVTQALLQAGLIHFINIREIPTEWALHLNSPVSSAEGDKIRDLRRRLDAYFDATDFSPSSVVEDEKINFRSLDLRTAEKHLDEFGSEIRKVRDQQRQVQDEIMHLKELKRQLPETGQLGLSTGSGGRSYITVHTGSVLKERQEEFDEAFKDFPAVYMPGVGNEQEQDILITLRRDNDRTDTLLKRFGWEDAPGDIRIHSQKEDRKGIDIPGPLEKVNGKLEELKERQFRYEVKLKEFVSGKKHELACFWMDLRSAELALVIKGYYRKTERTYLFSGWIPADKQKNVNEILINASGGRCYLEWHNPVDREDPEIPKQVPVQMRNPKILKPFQSLVKNYGIPVYGSIDPTPVVAIFYLVMFGLMFGDAGHGLVVFLVGLAGSISMKKRKKKSILFPLITWCGIAAILFGVLFGSYFGFRLLPPLWFDYHAVVTGHHEAGSVRTLTDILVLTIYFGITVISTGLLINWYNHIKMKDWTGLIWDKGGILTGWIYGAGTAAAFYFIAHEYREFPGKLTLLLTLGIPVLLMGIKPFIEIKRHRLEHPGDPFGKINPLNIIMEWLVELLEIFSGYLSNTLSFMRVAGLGIAHVSLMVAFFQIAGMASVDGKFTVWSWVILIAGNILVIGLEGLSAGIQALRLNYYEFFSKYFIGNGVAYEPVSMRHKD